MIVKVLVENTECENCKSEHGLSLFVEYNGQNFLIDTGSSGLYSKNAAVMNVDLSTVNKAFLSHAHYDHSGGYNEFFEANTKANVYLQKNCRQKYYYKIVGPIKKYIGIPEGILDKYSDRFTYVDGYKDLGEGIHIVPHTTPDLVKRAQRAHMCAMVDSNVEFDDFSHEQTVVFEENDGLICFNSCSHAGVENIIKEIKERFPDKKIKAFFGGFHMMGAMGPTTCNFKKEEVQEVAKELLTSSTATFYSGHCTGLVAFDWLKEVMGDRLVALHSGKVIEV